MLQRLFPGLLKLTGLRIFVAYYYRFLTNFVVVVFDVGAVISIGWADTLVML